MDSGRQKVEDSYVNDEPPTPTVQAAKRRSAIDRPDILRLVFIAAAYGFAREFAFLFPDTRHVVMAIWPVSGVGLVAFLLSPRRLWPAIAAVLFTVGAATNLSYGRPWCTTIGFTLSDVLESWACGWFIMKWAGDDFTFERVKDVVALVVTVPLVMAVTSAIAAGTAVLAGVAPFMPFWQTWAISGGLGNLIVAPLIVAYRNPGTAFRGLTLWRTLETVLFVLVLYGVAVLSLRVSVGSSVLMPRPYVFMALLAWAALRFGQRGVSFAVVGYAIIAIACKAVREGPFIWGGVTPTDRLLLAQIFMAFNAVVGYLLAATYAEARRSQAALSRRTHQLGQLASELTLVEHRERFRLAEMMHDHLQQLLVGARMQTDLALSEPPVPELRQHLALASTTLGEAIEMTRSITTEMSPPILFHGELPAALAWLGREMDRKFALRVDVEAAEVGEDVPEVISAVVFNATRELLLNVCKHAATPEATVCLRHDGTTVELEVCDHGAGIDPAAAERAADGQHFGLFSIRERVEALGGWVRIDSRPGGGTRVVISLPVVASKDRR